MKIKSLLIALLMLVAGANYCYAASFASSNDTCNITPEASGEFAAAKTKSAHSWFQRKIDRFRQRYHPGNDTHKGKNGSLSYAFGFCGLIPMVGALFSITAIVLGIIGIKKRETHSKAGLILGIATITVGIIICIAIFL